jgi:hypothetical protein
VSISPVQHAAPVHQNEPTTNPTTAGDKTETKVAAVPQDKVTISAPAKQASTENANETSGAGETQQAGH